MRQERSALMIVPLIAAAALSSAHPPTNADVAALRHVVDSVTATFPMSTATLGVSVVDSNSGRVLFERDANKEFAPASNFKLVVAAAALAYIGPYYRYRTRLVARGPIANGTLEGDLILVGSGDPVLSRTDLAAAAKNVAAAGISRIQGAVLADDSLFDEQRYGSGWAWDDFPYYYQPPIQALSVDEGLANVSVTPGSSANRPVLASIQPNGGAMTVVSTATTSPASGLNDVDCFRSPGSTQIVVVGHYPAGSKTFTFGCAVDDSAAFASGTMAQLLNDAGITVGKSAIGPLPPQSPRDIENSIPAGLIAQANTLASTTLWTHDSPPVSGLIAKMFPPSDNFIAEHLFKMLPVPALHQRGTFDGGAEVERRFLSSLGLDSRSLDNGDGSGLSQGDRITPHDLTTILRWEQQSANEHAYVGALALAGVNGTVRKHLRGSDAVGRVRAKDGYIWHVSTFSGYAWTKRHGVIIFSVMFNDANGSLKPFLAAEDKIVETIVDWP